MPVHHRHLADRACTSSTRRCSWAPFGEEGLHFTLYKWVPAGDFTVDFNLAVDALTAVLLIVVTTIGMLVHVYSIGYMAHDPGRWRFFAYLNFFMFSMLLLVLADNFLLLFAAWELVGLSSYLLIGFWYQRHSAALANQEGVPRQPCRRLRLRARASPRSGRRSARSTSTEVFELLPAALQHTASIQPWQMTGIALLLFMGAMGKSAQFPLHVWLPDAMEGPTPVSALIHAATMVNAGVYFVARANPIFAEAPQAMIVVAAVGIFTAILAASIAFTQRDIKRVLAYSTLSQLGYMFAGLGVGAFVAAIFHLMTHGFFKGLLFLGSGSVIHAVHEEQDMNKMGALWRKIPITHWTMLIGSIAHRRHPATGRLLEQGRDPGRGLQERLRVGLDHRHRRGRDDRLLHVPVDGQDVLRREPRRPAGRAARSTSRRGSMTLPLILLAIPSLSSASRSAVPARQQASSASWLEPGLRGRRTRPSGCTTRLFELAGIDGILIIIGAGAGALGVALGIWFFGLFRGRERVRARRAHRPTGCGRCTRASFAKWWFDDLNDLIFVRFGGWVARACGGSTYASSTAPSTASRR